MKTSNLIILLCLSIFLLSSCKNNDKIIGTWERYGDDFAGMRVKVVKEGEHIKGTIIFATDMSKELLGFAEGDVKWKNIKKTTENKYEFEDLGKSPVGLGKFQPSYDLTNLELVSENEIYTRGFSKGTEWIGTEQKWKRVNDE